MKFLEAAKPKLRVYKPQKQGDRWLLRADVEVAGELIELQANATAALADRARAWYNRSAARFAKKFGYEQHGAGVFADVPHIVSAMGQRPVVPRDADISAAAKLYFAGAHGDPVAEEQIDRIYRNAWRDQRAQAALDNLMLIESALFNRDAIDMRQLMMDAALGSPHAQKVIAALYQVSTASDPTRLSWWVDDYVHSPERMIGDLATAAGDEVYARIVTPGLPMAVRRVHPGLPPMQRTWDQIMRGH